MNSFLQLILKTILTGFLSLSFASGYSSTVLKQNKTTKQDSSSNVKIHGRIVVKNKNSVGSYKVEVMRYDSVTSTFTVKNNQSIKFSLKKDSPYVLKISKKGFVPRLICINTRISENLNKNGEYTFYIETDFIAATEAMRMDNEALTLPVALIAYDKNTGNFGYNKDYSLFVQQKLHSGLSEASH